MNFMQRLGILVVILLLGAMFRDGNAAGSYPYPSSSYTHVPSYTPDPPYAPDPRSQPYFHPPAYYPPQQPPYVPATAPSSQPRIAEVLLQAYQAVKANHENHSDCRSRQKCLNKDKKSLTDLLSQLDPRDPARPVLLNLIPEIDADANNQIAETQQVILQDLSPERRKEYQEGLRVLPTSPSAAPQAYDYGRRASAPASLRVNQDDVLTILIQNFDNNHSRDDRCPTRQRCLASDIETISRQMDSINPQDPVYTVLAYLKDRIVVFADSQLANSLALIKSKLPLQYQLAIDEVETKEKLLQPKGISAPSPTKEGTVPQPGKEGEPKASPRYVQQRVTSTEPAAQSSTKEEESKEDKDNIIEQLKAKATERLKETGKGLSEKFLGKLGGLEKNF